MGLLEDLDYEVKSPGAPQRAIQRVASTGPGAWLLSRTLYPIDEWVFRRTEGRNTPTSMLAGLPVVMLTTTGAKSGERRTSPLLGIPDDGNLAVIGSNYGQKATPGWVYNLEAEPDAELGYRDRTVAVRARRADAAETEHAFRSADSIYGGFEKYVDRAEHRTIRVFILEARPTD